MKDYQIRRGDRVAAPFRGNYLAATIKEIATLRGVTGQLWCNYKCVTDLGFSFWCPANVLRHWSTSENPWQRNRDGRATLTAPIDPRQGASDTARRAPQALPGLNFGYAADGRRPRGPVSS